MPKQVILASIIELSKSVEASRERHLYEISSYWLNLFRKGLLSYYPLIASLIPSDSRLHVVRPGRWYSQLHLDYLVYF